MNKELLFRALSDVGDDLLVLAQTKTFRNPWKQWLPAVACIALVLCLGAMAVPWLSMGMGASEAPQSTESAGACPEEETEPEPSEEEAVADTVLFEGRTYALQPEPVPLSRRPEAYLGLTDSGQGELSGCEVYEAETPGVLYIRVDEVYYRAEVM